MNPIRSDRKNWSLVLVAACALVGAGGAAAQEETTLIERDAAELEELITHAVEPPSVETALVFSSRSGEERRVVCRATNAQGGAVGHAATRVPAHGVRHLLASDFSGGEPFLGQVVCFTRPDVAASAFAAGGAAGLTDVPVQGTRRSRAQAYRFPVVATR